jgi:hypothetical protein
LATLVVWLPSVAYSDRDNRGFNATLTGFHENEAAVFTDGHATIRLTLSDNSISYELHYADLTGNPLFAHIHLGERHVNGGVIAFLCGGGSKPACPATPATVTGTIAASDILAPTIGQGISQGLPAGNMADAQRAIRAGAVYANVHTPMWPGGEIRGQLTPGGNDQG